MLKVRDQKGFTLIELLIVIAIIAILAAIAIPQFAEYRARGLESSMATDAKNAATAVEAVFADCQTYSNMGFTSGTGAGGATSTIGLAPANCPGNAAGSAQNVRVSSGNNVVIPGSIALSASTYSIRAFNGNARTNHQNVQVDQTGSLSWF